MLSQQGCAYVLTLHAQDLGAMTRSDRAAAEKVYGALISDRGCLRKQRSLREQLQTMLADRAPMRLHGPRLFMQLQGGLPFLPVPPEMFVRARQTLNMVLTYKLKPDATLATVSALLTMGLLGRANQGYIADNNVRTLYP